jgi:hypothetical protein
MKKGYSDKTSITKLYVLMALTGGLYFFYWYISNVHKIKKHSRKDILVWWQTFGIFIPIINFFFGYEYLKLVKENSQEERIPVTWSPGWLLVGYLFLVFLARYLSGTVLVNLGPLQRLVFFIIAALIITYPLELVQESLNLYLEKKEKKKKLIVNNLPTFLEIIFVVVSWLVSYGLSTLRQIH